MRHQKSATKGSNLAALSGPPYQRGVVNQLTRSGLAAHQETSTSSSNVLTTRVGDEVASESSLGWRSLTGAIKLIHHQPGFPGSHSLVLCMQASAKLPKDYRGD